MRPALRCVVSRRSYIQLKASVCLGLGVSMAIFLAAIGKPSITPTVHTNQPTAQQMVHSTPPYWYCLCCADPKSTPDVRRAPLPSPPLPTVRAAGVQAPLLFGCITFFVNFVRERSHPYATYPLPRCTTRAGHLPGSCLDFGVPLGTTRTVK